MFKIWPLIYLLLFLMLCNHLWNVMYEDYIYFVSDIAALCSLCPINLSSQLFIAFLAVMYVFNFPLFFIESFKLSVICALVIYMTKAYLHLLSSCLLLLASSREVFHLFLLCALLMSIVFISENYVDLMNYYYLFLS